jgi:hypothetical protein
VCELERDWGRVCDVGSHVKHKREGDMALDLVASHTRPTEALDVEAEDTAELADEKGLRRETEGGLVRCIAGTALVTAIDRTKGLNGDKVTKEIDKKIDTAVLLVRHISSVYRKE